MKNIWMKFRSLLSYWFVQTKDRSKKVSCICKCFFNENNDENKGELRNGYIGGFNCDTSHFINERRRFLQNDQFSKKKYEYINGNYRASSQMMCTVCRSSFDVRNDCAIIESCHMEWEVIKQKHHCPWGFFTVIHISSRSTHCQVSIVLKTMVCK